MTITTEQLAALKSSQQWLAEWSASDAPLWVHDLISAVQESAFAAGRKAGIEASITTANEYLANVDEQEEAIDGAYIDGVDDVVAAIRALIDEEKDVR